MMTDIQRATAEFLDRVEALAQARMKGLLVELLSELKTGSQDWAGKIPLGSKADWKPSPYAKKLSTEEPASKPSGDSPKPGRTREEKLRIVALSKKVGRMEAARQTGASRDSILAWSRGKMLAQIGRHRKTGKSPSAAPAERLGINTSHISNWKSGKYLGLPGHPNLPPKPAKSKKYRSYSPAEKEEIMAYAREHNAEQAAKKFKMKTASSIRNWLKGKNLASKRKDQGEPPAPPPEETVAEKS